MTKDLTKVHVEIHGHIFNLDAGVEARIDNDLEGLNQNLAGHPAMAARWMFIETKIREIVEGLESKLEIMDAELFTTIPSAIEKEGKKPTVDTIKSYVVLDPARKALQNELLVRRHELNLITAGRQVLQVKRDCLLALASNMRAEMDHGLWAAKQRMREGPREIPRRPPPPQDPEPPKGSEPPQDPGWE